MDAHPTDRAYSGRSKDSASSADVLIGMKLDFQSARNNSWRLMAINCYNFHLGIGWRGGVHSCSITANAITVLGNEMLSSWKKVMTQINLLKQLL